MNEEPFLLFPSCRLCGDSTSEVGSVNIFQKNNSILRFVIRVRLQIEVAYVNPNSLSSHSFFRSLIHKLFIIYRLNLLVNVPIWCVGLVPVVWKTSMPFQKNVISIKFSWPDYRITKIPAVRMRKIQ